MKQILLSKKYSCEDELKIKALGAFEIFKSICSNCGDEVMLSAESKKLLDADTEIIVNCLECAPKEMPIAFAATIGQLKEMAAMRVKSRAQNN